MSNDRLTIEHVPMATLSEHPANARIGNVDAIVDSIRAHGQYRPLVVQRSTGHVVAGNHTLRALRIVHDNTHEPIPVIMLDIDNEQAKRILLVDNRASDDATYDMPALAALLNELVDTTIGLDGTGFTADQYDELVADMNMDTGDVVDGDDHEPITPPSDPITQPGDMWMLGDHMLVCGDASNPDVVERVINHARIQCAVTSPPYADRRKYDESSGFQPIHPDRYVEWFKPIAANVANHLQNDGVWIVNIKPGAEGLDTDLYVFDLVTTHVREWGWHFATEYTWERIGMPKSPALRLKNQFEPLYVFARDRWKFRPDHVAHESDHAIIPLGPGAGDTRWDTRHGGGGDMFARNKRRKGGSKGGWGRNQSRGDDIQGSGGAYGPGESLGTGMAYPGNRLPTFVGSHEATGHPAAYPIGLPEFMIRLYTDTGDHVFDPFAGSGLTILAAHNTNRTAHAVELSPAYCDIIVERFKRHTGIEPTRQ